MIVYSLEALMLFDFRDVGTLFLRGFEVLP
jgi:hypothetical protein